MTGHCSEFGLHWRNVETGLDLIHLERIDHGYTVPENPELTDRCVRENVPFTVVPSNTYYLKKWPEVSQWRRNHPIRQMAFAGMNIIPATDDWHMHNTNGMECYRVMVEEFGFVSLTVRKWVFRNLGGDFHARGLITRRLSSSNPARPYICRFSIFRRFTWPSTTPLLHLLIMASHIAAASVSIPADTR